MVTVSGPKVMKDIIDKEHPNLDQYYCGVAGYDKLFTHRIGGLERCNSTQIAKVETKRMVESLKLWETIDDVSDIMMTGAIIGTFECSLCD